MNLVALAFLLAAGAAYGQVAGVKNGQSDYVSGKSPYTAADTTFYRDVLGNPMAGHDASGVWRWMKVDASGNLLNSDAERDRDHILNGTLPIISGLYATGAVDSLAEPLDVHDYPNLSLLLERTGAGDARVAIQVRYHVAGFTDSSSVFPWMPVAASGTGVTVAWGDSTQGIMTTPTATVPGGDEGLFKMTRQAAIAPGMTGRRLIPIVNPSGPQWFDYITVRLRVLGQGGTSTYRVSLVGTAVR